MEEGEGSLMEVPRRGCLDGGGIALWRCLEEEVASWRCHRGGAWMEEGEGSLMEVPPRRCLDGGGRR